MTISSGYNNQNTSITNKTIMMIDDDNLCLSGMGMMLTGYCNFIPMNNGIEALEYLKSYKTNVDLILLDLMMPEISGLEVLHELQKDLNLASIPVILQSGAIDHDIISEADKLKIAGFINKPYKNKDAFVKIASVLTKQKNPSNLDIMIMDAI
jgi:response regulator RpfG family c-di-GMP phosphodiesterase